MIKFLVCGDVKAPKRNFGDAGFDFFIPEKSDSFVNDLHTANESNKGNFSCDDTEITLLPHKDIKIPSYVRALIPTDECLLMTNKSGIALNKKLVVGACLIDSSYEGIMNLHMINTSDQSVSFEYGQKIVQGVPYKIDCDNSAVFYEKDGMTTEEFYKDHDHSRGAGGFGSTGVK